MMNAIRTSGRLHTQEMSMLAFGPNSLPLAFSNHLRKWTYARVGREISRVTRYADRVVQVDRLPGDAGLVLGATDAPIKSVTASHQLGSLISNDSGVTAIL